MKAAEPRSVSSVAKSNSPFFSKDSERSFFSSNSSETSFFAKSDVSVPVIQSRLSVGQPDDKYEQEADAIATQVVENKKENDYPLQSRNIPGSIVQLKCDKCEEEEKLNKKEEQEDTVPGIQQKENIVPEEEKKEDEKEIQPRSSGEKIKEEEEDPDLQAKCDSCEDEKLQPKMEKREEDLGIQRKPDENADQVLSLQTKCATCEEEEKLQEKEEKKDEKEELRRKPIFESNAEPEDEKVQAKCDKCEEEEKVKEPAERKEEENDLQRQPLTGYSNEIVAGNSIQQKCEACELEEKEQDKEKEKEKVQRKPATELNGTNSGIGAYGLPLIQAKLTVGKPGDKYEKEADAIADKTIQRINLKSASTSPAEKTLEKDEEEIMAEPMPEILQMASMDLPNDGLPPSNPDNNNGNSNGGSQSSSTFNVQRACRECEEGDVVFRKGEPMVQRAGGTTIKADGSRESILALAKKEIGKVEAKHDDGSGKRKGADRLLEYFNVAAPGVWPDSIIETAGVKMPSWCGIFTVWAHNKAGKNIGTWQMGKGVSAFNTLTQTNDPQPGDIGYKNEPYQHHNLIVKVEGNTIHSIDGNSGLFSEVKENTKTRADYDGFFTAFGGGSGNVQRKEDDDLQAREENSAQPSSPSIEEKLSSSKGGGSSLPEQVKAQMESAMGADFSNVKIHTDSQAVSMSKDLHAQAFTHGSDIYFNSGKYEPGSRTGQHLLSHELTHTVQQGAAVQRQPVPEIQREEEEKLNYNITIQFREEIVFMGFSLNQAALDRIKANTDSDNLIRKAILKSLQFDNGSPVYETPTFLKTDRVRKLIKADLEAWPGTDVPVMTQFRGLIVKRSNVLMNTLITEAVDNHLNALKIDPSFIDWNIVIPQLKERVTHWEAKEAIEASEHDQYEWVLDLMADEVKGMEPVVGAKPQDPDTLNGHLYPYVINNNELFSEEVIREHSEKFVMPWLARIKEVKFVPDKFSIEPFTPGEEIAKAERTREKLLSDFIKTDVPDLMFKFVLDQWTGSGVNPDIWLKNLNIDSYKARLLDHLSEEFLKKAKNDPDFLQSLKLQALEKTKFNIIRMFYLAAARMQTTNEGLEQQFRKGHKDKLDKEMVAIIENPAAYYDLSVKIASATTQFLGNLKPDRSLSNDMLVQVMDILKAMEVPEKLSALAVFFVAVGGYLKEFKTAVDEEKTKVKEAIKNRINVDYDGIAKVVKNWQKVAEVFMEKKFKPMLKTVALEWLAANRKELQNILDNYDTANAKYAQQMNDSAAELQEIEDGLVNDEYEEIEYEGEVLTKADLPHLKTTIQFLRDEANARLSTKNAEKEKGKLKEALEVYGEVKQDVINDEFDWLDYAPEIFVEARKRLGISEFPEYTTYRDVFTGRAVAEKSPFLAMVIQNYYWKENVERKMFEAFKIIGLGILTVAAMFIPGVGGLVLGAIDIAVGIGMGVKGVIDAKEVLRMAKLDIHGTIRGVSVEQAEAALKHAWLGLIVTVALTAGPFAISRALKVRGAGGVKLSKQTRSWERTLSKETRDALKANPNLRKIYAEMDDSVRAILTLCESPCIPLGYGPSPAEIARIKTFMKNVKVPQNHAGLREFLHHPARRNNLTAAMNELNGVKNMGQLEKQLERAIAANVKQAGASASKVNGVWTYTKADGTIVREHEIASHGSLTSNRGTNRFFQSHHGIQDAWAMRKGIKGYSRDDCPAILLRDSKMGTPHQVVSARQSGRFDTIDTRTYAQERELLKADMKAAGVGKGEASAIVNRSDLYFGKLYRGIEATGNTAELVRIFGTWKP